MGICTKLSRTTKWAILFILSCFISLQASAQTCQAKFNYSIDTARTVTFTDLSIDSFGVINSWNWDFGDSSEDTVQNPVHTYTSDGAYEVSLLISDSASCTDSITLMLYVCGGGCECTANFNMVEDDSFRLVSFTDLSFVDSGNVIESWQWYFGDGDSAIPTP